MPCGERINAIVRERLVHDGTIAGPAMNTERLASRGYTNAEKSLAANYAPGDVVAFHRPYKRLGVEKGDELRIAGIDPKAGIVNLVGKGGGTVAWEPGRLAARTGGVEVYGVHIIELRRGDRVRWTRNDATHGLVNSGTAEVTAVKDGKSLSVMKTDGCWTCAGTIRSCAISTGHGHRPCMLSGTYSRYRDRDDGGQPPPSNHTEDPLRRDQPRLPPRRAGDRRPGRVA